MAFLLSSQFKVRILTVKAEIEVRTHVAIVLFRRFFSVFYCIIFCHCSFYFIVF